MAGRNSLKPAIGITAFFQTGERKPYNSISYHYINSIVLAGGVPFIIPITDESLDVNAYLDRVDGILFTGGEDVLPKFYNENPITALGEVSPRRDEFELRLFKEARKRRLPILGICRGAQVINVAMGGNLYQDINTQVKDSLGHSPSRIPVDEIYHSVKIDKDSKLYEMFKEQILYVNSFHHQAVKELAGGLKATACSEDGIIEAYEGTGRDFIFAVQWHPEDLVERYPHFLKIFSGFVDRCSRK